MESNSLPQGLPPADGVRNQLNSANANYQMYQSINMSSSNISVSSLKRQPLQLKWILASSEQTGGSTTGAGQQSNLQQMMSSGVQSGEEMSGSGSQMFSGQTSKGYSTPQIKNHTATLYNKKLFVFGGYDGKKNHSNLRIFDTDTLQWTKTKRPSGNPPTGRNGHTATLVGK